MKFKEYITEEEVIVVDFQKQPENVLNKVIKKYKAKVTDWVEKDYGLKVIIDVPSNKVKQFKSDVSKLKDYDIET